MPAFDILKLRQLDPNLKNLEEVPLVALAIQCNDTALLAYLRSKGVNLNVHNPKNHADTPLHQAIRKGRLEMVQMLLQDPSIDINAKNKRGWTPLALAAGHPAIFKLLQVRGALVNYKGEKPNVSPLAACVSIDNIDWVTTLLGAQADPNFGEPSALVMAIHHRHLELVKQLLAAGGKPFAKGEAGVVPVTEAVLRGSSAIVDLLLEQPDCQLDVPNKEGLLPAVAALFTGDQKKMSALRQRDAPFPTVLSTASKQIIKAFLYRQQCLGDYASVKELLAWNQNRSWALDYYVAKYFLKKDPQFLYELIASDALHPSTAMDNSIFFTICQQAVGKFAAYKKLIAVCIQKNVNVDCVSVFRTTPLERALAGGDVELAHYLLQAGARLTATSDPLEAFSATVALGDLKLVKLACARGGNIQGQTGVNLPLQIAAKNLTSDAASALFKWLVKKGADLNAVGVNERTPFGEVILGGNLTLVEYCLAHGAEIILKDPSVIPPLIWAATLSNDPQAIIFKKLAEQVDLSSTQAKSLLTWSFATLLPHATVQTLEWVVQAGANINTPENARYPIPLVSIIARGDRDLVEWCLAKGADVNLNCHLHDSPLQAAVKLQDRGAALAIFKLLLAQDADINDTKFNGGRHILYAVIAQGDTDLLAFCLQQKATLATPALQAQALRQALEVGNVANVQLLREQGYKLKPARLTAATILNAYAKGGEQMLQQLLALQADFKAMDEDTRGELWELIVEHNDVVSLKLLLTQVQPSLEEINAVQQDALKKSRIDILRALVDLKFPLDPAMVKDSTLRSIVQQDDVESLKLLVSCGLDVTKKQIEGGSLFEDTFESLLETAIVANHPAAQKPVHQVVRYLIEAGIDVKQRLHSNKRSAIYAAVETGDLDLVKILLEAGAYTEIYTRNVDNRQNAIGLARKNKNQPILELLLEYAKRG